MRNLSIALVLIVFVVVITYLILISLGTDKAFAASLSTSVIGIVPYLHQVSKLKNQKKTNPEVSRFVPFSKFTYSFKLTLFYAFLFSFSALNLIGSIAGLISLYAVIDIETVAIINGFINLFFGLPILFFIGRWVGIKASSKGVLIILLSAFFTRAISTAVELMFIPSGDYKIMFLGAEKSFPSIVFQIFSGTVFFGGVAMLGYWLGRKQQLVSYMAYLMAKVKDDVRKTIIELAFEEIEKSEIIKK